MELERGYQQRRRDLDGADERSVGIDGHEVGQGAGPDEIAGCGIQGDHGRIVAQDEIIRREWPSVRRTGP